MPAGSPLQGTAIEVPGLAAPSMGLEVKAASVTDID